MQYFNLKNLQALLKPNLRFIRRVGYVVLSLACILLVSVLVPQNQTQLASVMTSKAVAQVVPSAPTGIYGGIPQSLLNKVRYAQLRHNSGLVATVPVNGTGNYVLYYKANIFTFENFEPFVDTFSDTFITPGFYQVQYLDGFGNLVTDSNGCNGSPGVCEVSYNPITDPANPNFYTLGLQVPGQPLNPPPTGVTPSPLGIYGFVTNAVTGLPIANVTVTLTPSGSDFANQRFQTNGNGFYSFYYTGNGIKNFLTNGIYLVGVLANGFNSPVSNNLRYNPPTLVRPSDPNFYVLNASLQQNFSLTPQ